ncbi:MAG: hypothetical protein SRB2_01738 [Desulfobacteraceae bacterium Eth-SRB2]|nr:MAG: hypothetical protein SRB2_01738 [Desulfobacteraceae bacterium Eth-SRB2]
MDTMADSFVKNFYSVVVKIKDGTTITGKLNIGDFPRVSDYFRNSPDKYFVLSEAEHRGSSGKVVIINKSEIVWAEPEDN